MKTSTQPVRTAIIEAVEIPAGTITLQGDLIVPASATGITLFAHGSGSSRKSPRNQFVASMLHDAGIGTLLFDLLTPQEEHIDRSTAQLRFNIGLLASRLVLATEWLAATPSAKGRALGYFGASTGGAAALVAAAQLGDRVRAIVSRGGRPDLAGEALPMVTAPTLLIVGGFDYPVIDMNRAAFAKLRCEKRLQLVPGATHLFEEPGTLEEVGGLAANWFAKHFREG